MTLKFTSPMLISLLGCQYTSQDFHVQNTPLDSTSTPNYSFLSFPISVNDSTIYLPSSQANNLRLILWFYFSLIRSIQSITKSLSAQPKIYILNLITSSQCPLQLPLKLILTIIISCICYIDLFTDLSVLLLTPLTTLYPVAKVIF